MAQVQAPTQVPIAGTNGSPTAMAAGAVAGAAGVGQFPSTSLYVGDLDPSVMDNQLYDVFSHVGPVVSVRVSRDVNTRRSLGYGYVNYSNPIDASRAIEMLNFQPINGKAVRIMYSNRDPSSRRSGAANIYIKNLDKGIDNKGLYDTFSAFGSILSCKVAVDQSGQSKGYGFVQYEQEEAAETAISNLNGMLLNGKQVYVGPFLRKQERESSSNKPVFSNVFVKNLSETTTKENLEEVFGQYGDITSAVVMREGDGKSKCFGFVNFIKPEDAARAVEELNGKKFDDKEWYVGKAQKKSEREQELKGKFDQSAKEVADKFQGVNLHLKNLDDSIGDDKLRELFSEFGTITSCKVMRDPNGISRGSGFVAFLSAEDASRAAQFSQMRPVALPANVAPRMPMYPPGAPGVGQQLFYGQGPPALISPQPGFGYQQQLVPGMRPGGAPLPNFFVPMIQQGQQPQRPGGRRAGGGPMQQAQHSVPMLQQHMLPRGGRVYRYPQGRNMQDVQMPGVAGGMLSVPYDMAGMPMRDAGMSQPIPIGALATALANASPDQQRTMLGESLYPLVDQLEHESAAKVTGMLLEMDQTEVLHLLESPEALKAKVAEAMDVLRNVAAQPGMPTYQLASLSLNDGIVS